MIKNERQNEILEILKKDSFATVTSLAERLYASMPTIRRDLTMLEEDGDGSLIAVVGAFEGEEYDNVYNAVRDQWENDTDTDLDKCCSIARVDIEDMIYDVVDTIVENSSEMKWKDNSDRILGFIYNGNNELAA